MDFNMQLIKVYSYSTLPNYLCPDHVFFIQHVFFKPIHNWFITVTDLGNLKYQKTGWKIDQKTRGRACYILFYILHSENKFFQELHI